MEDKPKVKKGDIVRYVVGGFFILSSLRGMQGDLRFIFFTFIGISLLPIIYKKLNIKKRYIQIVVPTLLFFLLFLFAVTTVSENDNKLNDETTTSMSEANNVEESSEMPDKVESENTTDKDEEQEISEDEYKMLCEELSYKDILRNSNTYKKRYCRVLGTVDQIIEGWFGHYIIYIRDNQGNKWECSYYYKESESHLLEDDYVIIYGLCDGTAKSETVLGKQVILPKVNVEYIELR